MMWINIYIVLIISLFANLGNTSDSDGKEFVFTFINDYASVSSAITTTVIVIPIYNDSICTFRYTQTSDNRVVSFIKTVFYGKTNEISFDYSEVLLTTTYPAYKFNDVSAKDFRIFASCTEEVKLIGKLSDPVKSWGDHFLIPSTKNGNNKYILPLPTNYYWLKGSITILPISQGESITVNIVGYVNGALFSNETIRYDTIIGQNQHYITVDPTHAKHNNANSTIMITASSPIMLAYASWVSTSNMNDNSCGTSCMRNYVAFMPMPVVAKQCNDLLFPADQRMIRNDFTTRLYVSPPSVDSGCDEIFTMIIYDKNDNVNGHHEVITAASQSTIDLTDKSEMASSSYSGQIPMYRLGSILNYPDSLTAYGHFAHIVPSIQEWVTGKTQFYTLAKNCYIEFYADQDGVDPDLIKVDGIALSNYDYDLNRMHYFNRRYGHFILELPGYGLHTLENGGNYVLYVICKNVNGAYDAAGYLTGYNQRKQ